MTAAVGRGRKCVRLLAAAAVLTTLLPQPASAVTGLAGLAGTDTALPATASAMTKSGSGEFATLKVTVNQTQHLLNQALSVTWTGGVPTDTGAKSGTSVRFKDNFLQIFQCWGDDGTNTGPPPEQCEFGGVESVISKFPSGVQIAAQAGRDVDHSANPADYNPSQGFFDGGVVYSPYRSVDGTVVNKMRVPYTGPYFVGEPGQVWANPYFDAYTTNEIDLGRTYPDGTGSELFQVYTGQQARGLGCGQKVLKQPDGSMTIPKCWLVVIPRGFAPAENAADHDPGVHNPVQVETSPLAPNAWQHRIVVPLDFNPADSACSIGAVERRIIGNEMAIAAVSSWQPTLCQTPGLPPFAYGSVGDDQARRILVSGDPGAAGMAVISSPLDSATVDPSNPVVYAPLTLSGLVIGFNVERSGGDKNGNVVDPGEAPLNGTRIAHIQLTPRLVAKLLTESYRSQFIGLDLKKPGDHDWIRSNPTDLFDDPDFRQYNPEFAALSTGNHRDAGGLVLEENTSDAARQVWQWVLADPEAKAWLAGTPDMTGCPSAAAASSCGMRVNPAYTTDPAANPAHIGFASLTVPNSFPKRDSYCYQDAPGDRGDGVLIPPRPLCMQDAFPYSLGFAQSAQETRAADDQAKLTHNVDDLGTRTAETWWSSDGPQIQFSRTILSITDTASAQRYGLQIADLSRAGDDKADRSFVAPDQNGLAAGAQSMVPGPVAGVLQPNPATSLAGAYPLTSLTYAAVTPRSLDGSSRRDYAAFVTYGAGPGQVPGLNLGELPPGYAPLPASLAAQAKAAASAISSGDPASPSTPTNPASGQPKHSGSGPSASGSHGGGGAAPSPGNGPQAIAGNPTSPLPATPRSDSLPFAIVHTMGKAVGSMRYTLPVALTVALMAGLAGVLLNQRRGKTAAAARRLE